MGRRKPVRAANIIPACGPDALSMRIAAAKSLLLMITLQVRISISPVPPGLGFEVRDLIIATDGLLKEECGGSCVGIVEEGRVTLEAHTNSKEQFASMMESYCQRFREEKRTVEVLLVEAPTGTLSADERAAGARLNTTGKLTKSYFMKQPAGGFLASHDIVRDFEPLFAETIESSETRAAQWQRIRAAGVDQRACHIFPSREHFERWQQDALDYFRARQK